jgi:hypothetical protein
MAGSVPVSMRALVQRVNRQLAKKGEQLRAARGEGARQDVGDFFIISVAENILVRKEVNLEELGRELGVLQPWESVAGPGS